MGGMMLNRLSELTKKYIVLCFLIPIELILLIIVGSGYPKEKLHMDIPYTDLVGTTIPDERDGWYMDETFPCLESGLFDYTEDIALKRGTYDITVRYETDTDSNYCTTSATTKYYHSLKTDKTPLQCRAKEITFTIYLLEDVENFRIETYFGKMGYMIIKGFSITETRALIRIELFWVILISLLVNLFYIVKRNRLIDRIPPEKLYAVIGIVAIAVVSSLPTFIGYYTRRDDTPFHLLRIEGIKEGLLQGQFPVKIQPNWIYGYGYPVSIYYGDLFLYIPAFLRLVGFPVHTAYNFLLILINFATAAIAYISLHKTVKDRYIAMTGTLLYTMAPYRLMNMYNRNGLGEVLAVTFLPLIVYGFYIALTGDIKDKKYKASWVPLVIGLSGIIQSHTLTCILCAIFIIPLCIIKIKTVFVKERFIVLVKAVIYTALLNLWFIYPFVSSLKSIAIMQPHEYTIQGRGTKIVQLFNLLYKGMGYISEDGVGTMTLGVGLTLGMALFLYPMLRGGKLGKDECTGKYIGHMKPIFWMSLLSLFMTTIYFPWDYLTDFLGKYNTWILNIQFPWRFLEVSCVLLVFLFAMGIKALKDTELNKWIPFVLMLFTTLGVIAGMSEIDGHIYGWPPSYAYDIDALGLTGDNVTEYVLPGTDVKALIPEQIALSDNIICEDYLKRYTTISFTCENISEEEGYIELPLLWYENYIAKDTEARELVLEPGNNNVIRVIVPVGYNGAVTIKYRHYISWRIAEIISLIFVIGFIGNAIYIKKRKKE